MNIIEFLKQQVGVFKDFSADRLKQLVDGSRVASFEANEVILHQGAEAAHFGVVLNGAVAASVTGDGGTRQALGRLEAQPLCPPCRALSSLPRTVVDPCSTRG